MCFYTSTQCDQCNTQCHQQRLVYLCQVQVRDTSQILPLSIQILTVHPFLMEWNMYSHSNGNKGINLGQNVLPSIKNYWSISEGMWLELESYDLNMKQRGRTSLSCKSVAEHGK